MDYYRRATDKALFEAFITARDIDFVRFVVLDFSGITRQRILTTSYCRKTCDGELRYGLSSLITQINVSGTGELGRKPKQQKYELVPDWFSLRECKFSPSHAWVMCFIYVEEEINPFAFCPRYLLAGVLQRAADEDEKFLIGFEFEFSLLDETLQPIQDNDIIENWCSMAGLRGKKLIFMEDVVRTLRDSNIEVTHFHAEAFQQLEFATSPNAPLAAVDNLVYTQELLKTMAVRSGYRASLSTMPILDAPTGIHPANVCHVHFSISQTGQTADHFLAGVLRNLPIILPVALPTFDSYLNPDFNQEGVWISFGTENRDTAVRKIEGNHWELRTVDAATNAYMLLAILLASGLDGIQSMEPLTWKDLRYHPRDLSDEALASSGVTERLPNNFKDALDTFRKSDKASQFFGEEMKQAYLHVKDSDEKAFSIMTQEERRRLYIRYF